MTASQTGAVHAARRLLDRAAPAEYLHEWTERIAQAQTAIDVATDSVVVFRIETEWLGLPAAVFEEVTDGGGRHSIPHRPGGIAAGIAVVRGELLLCASLAGLLDVARTNVGGQLAGQRLLVASRHGNRVAFPVDEVHGIVRYQPDELSPVPATLANARARYTRGLLRWNGRTVGCLDEDLLFRALDNSFA